jgi:c-di-GMP-binding flagellar brake protein YcgR
MPLEGVNLLVTMEGECFMVTIDRAMVKRIEKGTRAKHFGIAFEFLAIGNEFKKRLTKIIYDIQRNLLMNRLQDKI